MFQRRISAALANPSLQVALDRNSARRMGGRSLAFDSLPEAEAVRDRARAIRLETLARLDFYLEQFAARLEERGVKVHWAPDAASARRIIVALAQEGGVQVVAKSKSMVSEEIDLNRALLEAGVRPVETDLGEFIVQLRGETPSHIIAPAIHLRREEVAQTFQQHLGMAPTLNVTEMTVAARQALRQTFLTAEMGLSGVNFGVAETGTLCLVTNEGNGRMVTSVPRIHVALMGLERLVPRLEDLDVMLKVLARSATGQKLTVYTSLLNGPRRPSEPDGPEELHVILLDNGRSRTLASELAESLLCIRCGACLNVCPVYREIGGHAYGSVYAGPIGSVLSSAFEGADAFGHLAHASTLCGACQEVCPVRIDLPRMLLAVRGEHVQQAPQPAWLSYGIRLYAWAASDIRRFQLAQSWAAFATGLLARGGWVRRLPGPLGRWTATREFPAFARETFRARYARRHGPESERRPPAADSRNLPVAGGGTSPAVASIPSETSISARGAILSRVQAATRGSRRLEAPAIPSPKGEFWREVTFLALASRFGQELSALGGTFALANPDRLPYAILDVLSNLQVGSLLAWLPEALPVPGLLDRLKREGLTAMGPMLPAGGAERETALAEWGSAGAGITGAEAALAETGSLVLRSATGRGRLASLLPPAHIAVVRPSQIFASFEAWLAFHRGSGTLDALLRDSSSLTLVTGPSRTADIEMTLTIGVHGPAKLYVFCVVE